MNIHPATGFTLTDARLLRADCLQAVIVPINPRDFVAYIGREHAAQAVARQFTERALALGWSIDVLQVAEYGDYVDAMGSPANQPTVVFSLSKRQPAGRLKALHTELQKRGALPAPVNSEEVRHERFIVSRPANLVLERKPARLAAMKAVIEAAGADGFADVRKLGAHRIYINRLFAEGLLERSWDDANRMRPSSGGRLWMGDRS